MAMGHGEISLEVGLVIDACTRTINAVDKRLRLALRRAASAVATSAHRQHSYQDRTGNLSNSIHAGEVSGGTELRVDITANTPYAAAIEYGARPHKINAKPGKWLRFGTVSGVVFAKSVNHPGNRPYKYLAGALERESETVNARVGEGLAAGFRDAGFEVHLL
jgi:Bacteriophage HK97-gp10, putative tail-component